MIGEEIAKLLEKKKVQGFTGCVKLVFEDGKLALASEANWLDLPMTKVFSQKAVFELVATAAEKDFCGSVVFSFNHGEIEFYSFLRSYKGNALAAFLDEGKEAGKK